MVRGLTTASLGTPDLQTAMDQHLAYVDALKSCGLEVVVLEADETFPDGLFVEDTAVVTPRCAVLTHLGAPSRVGEEASVERILRDYFPKIEKIIPPGRLEGGDVMQVGDHFYVGLSKRTNIEGYRQFNKILSIYGYTCKGVELKNILHLKTGLAYLENQNLLMTQDFIHHAEFQNLNRILVDPHEAYAANCIWVNGSVLGPAGFPGVAHAVKQRGYPLIPLQMSEFRKLDGGLSCLSIRF